MNAENERAPLFPSRLSLSRNVLWIACVALIYFVAARLSLLLEFKPEGIAAIWPPEGVFLSAILLTRRALKFYLVGALCLADLVAELLAGTPFLVSAIYALTLTGNAVLSSWLLLRFVGGHITFAKVREVLGFLLLAVILSNGLLSLAAAAASDLLPGTSSFGNSWKWWAASDGIGNLLMTPFLLSWASWPRSRLATWNRRRVMEGAALFLPLALLNFFAFRHLSESGHFSLLLPYVTFPFLLWAALRFGVRGVTSALVILAAIAVSFAAAGPISGFPFYGSPLNTVIGVQLYLAILAIPSLFMVAVVTERKQAEHERELTVELLQLANQSHSTRDLVQAAVTFFRQQSGCEAAAVRLREGEGYPYFETRGSEADRRICTRNACHDEGYESVALLPLRVGEERLGLLQLNDRHPGRFTAETIALWERLAGHLAVTLAKLRADEALRESEARLNKAAEIAHLGSWELDLTTGHLTWSEEAYRIFGLSPQDFGATYQAFLDAVHPDDRAAVDAAYSGSLREGKDMYEVEHRVVRKSTGEIRYVQERCEHVRDASHRIVRSVGMVHDVTERRQAEEALRERNRYIETILENAPIGFAVNRIHDGKGVFASSKFEEIYGVPRGSLHSVEEYFEKVHPDPVLREQTRARVLADIATGDPARMRWENMPITTAAGEKKFITATNIPVFDQDLMVSTVQDVTARHQAEEALRESEERFRAAFEEGAVPMALTALDSTLLKVNSAFCRMLGFSEAELVGRSVAEITHPDDRAVNLVGIQRVACGAIPSFGMEKRYLRKDGAVIWVDMSTASVRDAQGRPLYCVTHIHDVTDRKQAEEALRSLNERLELQVAQRTEDLRHTVGRLQQLTLEISQAEDRERRRIADLLHDDVQQILAAAKFHLNLLSSEARNPEESREIIEQVKQMLKEAIEKSRSLSHELSPVLYQVDLTEVLNWLARHMQRRHGLIVQVKACGQVDSSSEPVKAFLYRVAQELLFNVVKHADVNEATIRVRRRRGCIYLSVVDRGRGFDLHRLEGAVGFGLLGIRERVQLLGGQMKIKSTRGVGSRILIAVPDEELAQVVAPTESGDGWVQTQNL